MLEITKLPSGLQIATYKIDRQIAALNIKVRAGFRFEKKEQVGLSHFLEHELFEGTKKYPTAQLLNDSVDVLGGNTSAHTSYEEITYDGDILLEYLPQLLDTMSQQIQESLLTEESIEKEKSIILQEMHKRKDDNDTYLRGHLVNESLWPGQGLSSNIDDNIRNLATIDSKSLKNFLETYYNQSNMVICLAGKVDHAEWVEKISSYFSKLPSGDRSRFNQSINQSGKNRVLVQRPTNQVKLSFCYYGPSRGDPTYQATSLLVSILGLRLFYRLVYETGMAYNAWSHLSEYLDTGSIEFGCGFASGETARAFDIIQDELERVVSNPPSSAELNAAKARRKSKNTRTSESVFGLANEYARRIIRNVEPILIEDELKMLDSVTLEEIEEASKKWLNKTYKIAAIGPEKDIKELEGLYGN